MSVMDDLNAIEEMQLKNRGSLFEIMEKFDMFSQSFLIAIEALLRIKTQQGMVCGEYEICTHESCRSSHASWEIAAEALEKIDKIQKGRE